MTAFKQLRELVTFKGGGTPSKQVPEYWNGDIPWATVKDFTSTSLFETQDFISKEGLRNSSANLIPKGHVVIPTRMSLGKAAINTVDLAINQDLRALVPIVPLDTRFPLHAVLSLKDEIVKKGAGATVKGITQEELYKLEIAFPPLDDQIRIAHLLGKVEGLIAQRKQHIQQLDDLLKSVFLEMFGDPVRNEKGWATEKLGDIALIERGRFSPRPRNDPKFYGGEYPFIQTGDISRSKGRLREYTQTLNEFGIKVSKEFKVGTVVIAIVGATIGETALLEIPTYAPDSVIGITPKGKDTSEAVFIEYVLRFWKPVLRAKAPEAARANINIETLRPLAIVMPPSRAKFSETVIKVEGLKVAYQNSLSDLETLYGALSQQAFKGELDLSRVPLPADQAPQSDQLPLPADIAMPTEVPNCLVQDAPPESRSELLTRWFSRYLENTSPDAGLGSRELLESAWQTLQETRLETEGESPALNLADYDALKDLIFVALKGDTLMQTFDTESNSVSLQKRTADWGTF